MDTIYALSSGSPPAGIAVIRVSGPCARNAVEALVGSVPEPRRARLATLRDRSGGVLDKGLVLFFPGPGSVTGEDLAEFHLHGGRAVVSAVEEALGNLGGLRLAEAGEFTRRAFANGRIDLSEAEGLADLLAAETQLQRRMAVAQAGGVLSRRVEAWRGRLLQLSAQVEAALDFVEDDDAGELSNNFVQDCAALQQDLAQSLSLPSAEPLREGYRVALAGPPNAGKSTLFNALLENEAAITAPVAGTTRDVLVRPVALGGVPFQLVDMAGLHDRRGDLVENIGMDRARAEIARADLVLWLGSEGEGPDGAWEIDAQCDRVGRKGKGLARHRVSAVTGEGLDRLKLDLVAHAREALPKPGDVALNRRQRNLVQRACDALDLPDCDDLLVVAEHLRTARLAFDGLIGRTSTEDVLDALFGRFCIGK